MPDPSRPSPLSSLIGVDVDATAERVYRALVLMLLLAGNTDAAVAARLGISLRTMPRRVRRLMDLAGTDSRVLLGWHARDRGWL
ncbi:hypothetical protein [Streptomyces sp. NPDC051286]|uniref:hypothetical protein n=1 Tax=Streptomyces sp. NPDC051286 TaxID=3365647 RepID=UPI003798E4B6